MDTWEYTTAELDLDDPVPGLNELGAQGWELAGISEQHHSVGTGTRGQLIAYLKRTRST